MKNRFSHDANQLLPHHRYGPRCEKTGFLHMRKQKRRSALGSFVKLISAFVYATQIEQSLFFLNPNFQASSHLLWLYSLVCVRPSRKPRRPVFSCRGSYYLYNEISVSIFRNRMSLNANQAFYLIINNKSISSMSMTLAEVYRDEKDEDGFMYMTYASQEMFG